MELPPIDLNYFFIFSYISHEIVSSKVSVKSVKEAGLKFLKTWCGEYTLLPSMGHMQNDSSKSLCRVHWDVEALFIS